MKLAEIGWNFAETQRKDAQDFRAVYFNSFLVILPKFGSLVYTTAIPYKPLYGTLLLGLPVVGCTENGGSQISGAQSGAPV